MYVWYSRLALTYHLFFISRSVMTEKNEYSSFEDGIANLRLVGGRPTSSSSSSSSSRHHHHFEDTYTLVRELQCGSYGTVYVGLHNVRNREYAVKVIDRRYGTIHDE